MENINAEHAGDNIDFQFLYQAQASMQEWFESSRIPSLTANNIFSTLLERTQIIWYELAPEQGGEHEAFIRINSGKIPLTNAELIKALFLKRAQAGDDTDQRRFEQRQLELATEWDMIEARLRQPELWYLLNEDTSRKPTRIEFLFELLASMDEEASEDKPDKSDEYATFRYFNKRLQRANTEKLLKEWQAVKNLFLTIEEWYNNRDWYHQLGYLITVGVPVAELIKAAGQRTKTEFSEYVLQQIKQRVHGDIEQWDYQQQSERAKLRNVLLLFNIETLHQNKGASYRFPFQHYKGNGQEARRWSLEHIHAQNPQSLGRKQDYPQWLRDVRPYVARQLELMPEQEPLLDGQQNQLQPSQVLNTIDQLLDRGLIDKDDFDQVQQQVFQLLGEPEVHTIENMALLTANDNSALSNGVFPQKRRRVMELEREGSFIPIATRNVFLKYYSDDHEHLAYWTAADRSNYVRAIRETLAHYLTPDTTTADAN
ncbi:hypothetical protein [Hymenobacter jeollabukensis]|uniref:DUF1524 domain-containing protein n=1 Tax=Hymenobacter jeollabukensis TaxID=2025313 RepID=A0A5R8WGV6_9BACT|nr:hypothetical protein [Hymenobacter jeollabukensis]TLM87291.1 hypothetical protein FDY95_26065 [Hymenobacter jeollabukensis]